MKRSYYSGRDFRRAQTIDELRHLAHRRLPHFVREYVESGAEDEQTLDWNRRVFARWQFAPRTLVDTSQSSLQTRLLGEPLPYPLVVAPTGFNGLSRAGSDVDLARAAGRAGVPFTLSTFSNATLEQVARAATGPLWMQIYILQNFAITESLVRRSLAADVEALVITTDANVASGREWQRRCYGEPGKLTWRSLFDAALHPRWAAGFIAARGVRFENLREFVPPAQLSATRGAPFVTGQLKPTITWDDVRRVRALWPRKLLVKGVLSVADTLAARAAGADGVVLSNHGGRQLESAISPLDCLAAVRRAAPDFPLIVDSGYRRGNDVLKALALGADAVMLGRATLYGVIAGGADGAAHALDIIVAEMRRSMGLLGCNALDELAQCLVQRADAGAHSD